MARPRLGLSRLLLLLLTSVAPSLAPAASWVTPEGYWVRYPLPGAEVKSLTADPTSRGTFFLGTAQGSIYRSSDGGRTWASPQGGVTFPGYSVTAVVVDPGQAHTLWAGLTGVVQGGLLARSDDHGRSWYEVRSWDRRAASRVVAVSSFASSTGRRHVIAVGGDGGLEISEDGGASWRPSLPPLDPGSGISFLAFHPVQRDVLYCGSFRHPFRSTDLGRTWTRIANGMIEDTEVFQLDFAKENADDVWAATCGWVYHSTDAGRSWTRFKEGMLDRRTHTVRHDPREPNRVLAGTTGGLFESVNGGKTFRRLGRDLVVNALVFDPFEPNVLLIGTESEGVYRSDDAGLTLAEVNGGLAETRISAVTTTSSGRVVMARAADGASGGLWSIDPMNGTAVRLAFSPPSTVLALAASGERLLAGTHDGLFMADEAGSAFTLTLPHVTRSFTLEGKAVLAATDAGVFESRDGGRRWARRGTLSGRVEWVRRARFTGSGQAPTLAAERDGHTFWWDGRDWVMKAVRLAAGTQLTGGFGRARAGTRWTPDPIGLDVDTARALLYFRPENEGEDAVALRFPESGLSVAGWSGDPRSQGGLFLATLGRGLFRYLPGKPPGEPESPAAPSPRAGGATFALAGPRLASPDSPPVVAQP